MCKQTTSRRTSFRLGNLPRPRIPHARLLAVHQMAALAVRWQTLRLYLRLECQRQHNGQRLGVASAWMETKRA